MQQNRQQRRQENRRIHRHRSHPKYYRQFDGELGVYGQVFCARCRVHIAYLDQAEWQEVQLYDSQRREQFNTDRVLSRIDGLSTQTDIIVLEPEQQINKDEHR